MEKWKKMEEKRGGAWGKWGEMGREMGIHYKITPEIV